MLRPACCSLVLALLMLAGCDGGADQDAAPRSRTTATEQAAHQSLRPVETYAPPKPQQEAPTAEAPVPRVEITGPGRAAPQRLETDDILPLTSILQIATSAVPGEVIDVDLDDDDDDERPEYELEILTPQGRSIDVKIDARRGTILEIEED